MHCFITDTPRVLSALSQKGTLRKLSLSLTYRQNSPLLWEVLNETKHSYVIDASGFKQLRELVVDSAHLNRVKLRGRAALLDYLGANLEYLSFRNLSPSGVFSILEERCPKLKNLRVDRALTPSDLSTYKHPLLEELELKRCTFIMGPLRLPALKRLRFSASFRMEPAQVKALVAAMPKQLTHLSIEVPSSMANQLLVLLSRHLPMLEYFTLEGAFESSKISPRAVHYLVRRCSALKSIQIRHAKSVSALSFQSTECIDVLGQCCPNLSLLRMRYDAIFLPALHHLLSASNKMETLVLWQRKRWMQAAVWAEMEENLGELQRSFPNVHIYLEDV